MIFKLCRKCKTPIIHPLTYCTKCQEIYNEEQEEMKKARESKYNKNRDPKYKAFYNSKEWKMLKEKVLQDYQYKCQHKGCGKLAEDVHHKKYIQTEEGWKLRLDYDNCIPLCIEHHNFIHGRFQKKRKAVRK